jgi:hypothetical protein
MSRAADVLWTAQFAASSEDRLRLSGARTSESPEEEPHVITLCKQLLHRFRPVVLVTAFVAVLGVTGTAYSARLITGLDVRDGSLTAADLSKTARASLHGLTGARGMKGVKGLVGARGHAGAAGARGLKGSTGALGAQGAPGGFGQTGAQGPIGLQGVTGASGTASTVAGPQGPPGAASLVPGPQGPTGPGGTTEGASCTVSVGRTGTIHWVDSGSGTEYSLHCINVNL